MEDIKISARTPTLGARHVLPSQKGTLAMRRYSRIYRPLSLFSGAFQVGLPLLGQELLANLDATTGNSKTEESKRETTLKGSEGVAEMPRPSLMIEPTGEANRLSSP